MPLSLFLILKDIVTESKKIRKTIFKKMSIFAAFL